MLAIEKVNGSLAAHGSYMSDYEDSFGGPVS